MTIFRAPQLMIMYTLRTVSTTSAVPFQPRGNIQLSPAFFRFLSEQRRPLSTGESGRYPTSTTVPN